MDLFSARCLNTEMDSTNQPSKISRRDFFTLLTGAGVALCTGCKALDGGAGAGAGTGASSRVINAGPVSAYSGEGVYTTYLEEGFFVIREKGKLFALSSVCTHRDCLLTAEPDHSFSCHCHGSTFDENGKVTEGPATRNLPVFATSTDAQGNLLVMVTG